MQTIKIVAVWLILSLWGAVAHAGTHHYYYTDPQGTVLAKADASGKIIATYDYAPYGSQALGTPTAGPGYTGHVNDADTGLVYMQARYYDPATGRFLSVDPVGPSPGNLFNFNRYDYANNNPVVNIDPFGLYTCDRSTKDGKTFCGKIDKYVDRLHQARDKYKSNSKAYRVITKIMKYVGNKTDNRGPHYTPGVLPLKEVAHTDQNGTTTVDLNKGDSVNMVTSYIGHEAQHDLDVIALGHHFGDTSNRDKAKSEFNETEKNAYKAQSIILGAFGKTLTANEMQSGIDGSVYYDMSDWDSNHK